MGKYMRKSKATGGGGGDVAVGVRTRAKTLALQGSYLQLRSRRLVKPPILIPTTTTRRHNNNNNNNKKLPSSNQVVPTPESNESRGKKEGEEEEAQEASIGENVVEFEGRERTTRESTPCSLIRDPNTIRTPSSTTRPTNSADANRRIQNSSQRHIPTAHDMDEFFAGAEEEQQKHFIDKYNFDPVSDKPLPGRYEWKKVDP